jgi:ABC-type branched-subunit amino acid transport system substrate-binding protein
MITRRQMLVGSLAVAAMPAIARAQEKPYVVGTLFPMAGPGAENGIMFTNGAALALEHLRADKILKRPIELRAEDSRATPQGGATGMTKLVSVDEAVWVLIGFTGVSKAAAPIGERAKVITVNGGGTGPDLAGLSPYFWNVIPLLTNEVQAIIPWMGKQGYKRIGLIYLDDPAGLGTKRELEAGLPKIGATLAGTYAVPASAQQFGGVAARLRDDKVDAIYVLTYGIQHAQIIKQLRDNGLTQQIMASASSALPSVFSTPETDGLVYTSQVAKWDSDDAVTKRFVTDWRAKHKADPNTYNQNYYNALRLFGLLASSLEKAGKPVNGDNLRSEMLRVRKFSFVGGEGTFDDKGCISMPMQINQLKGGKPQVIG